MSHCDRPREHIIGPLVRGPDDAVRLVKLLVDEGVRAGRIVLGIDSYAHACGAAAHEKSDHCGHEPLTFAEQLTDIAIELRAESLVLITFVSEADLAPTPADVARFEGLKLEIEGVGFELCDHLLMSGHRWRSVREASKWW
jgi:hypothetical protein